MSHRHDHDHGHHDHHEDHFHDDDVTPEERSALADTLWRLEHVELTTVGVDIGSSTSHLMFSRVRLERRGRALSSRFVIVEREVLWQSPILLTPYRADGTIDAERLSEFVQRSYQKASLEPSAVDSGAVILTGEALKRKNARVIAELFAAESGKFVCASAGHHLEAIMAAHGSGAVDLSEATDKTILNVDIGGGTTKFATIRAGEVLHTAAVAVGGRLIVRDGDRVLVAIDGPARQAAEALGVRLVLGQPLTVEDEARLVVTFADTLVGLIRREPGGSLTRELLLTEQLPDDVALDAITFSGGVAEYLYRREERDYHDLGRPLAAALLAALADGRIRLPLLRLEQGIRATVIGASQFTVQVSGNTIFISDQRVLPLRNLPVLYPRVELGDEVSAEAIAAAIASAARRFHLEEGADSVALAFRWRGRPLYPRLRALAEGILGGLPRSVERRLPLVLLVDLDVGKSLGGLLKNELSVPGQIVSVDGLQLKEFDYVDIGQIIRPTNVVPVVIKSLLFATPPVQRQSRSKKANPLSF